MGIDEFVPDVEDEGNFWDEEAKEPEEEKDKSEEVAIARVILRFRCVLTCSRVRRVAIRHCWQTTMARRNCRSYD